jgi:WD40 repeat protein
MLESGFEARLARGLGEMADAGLRPFDARVLAESAVATPGGVGGAGRWFALGHGRRWASMIAAALVLAALIGLALVVVGSRLAEPPLSTTERLAFVRNGDIWVANLDGTAARRLATHKVDGDVPLPYFGVDWSPDGSRLAAPIAPNPEKLGIEPRHVEILAADGASLGSIAVEYDFLTTAWSPDGTHLAVLIPLATAGGLRLYDPLGRLERTLDLPPGYQAAKPMTFVGVSWSPDGQRLAVTGCPCGPENNGTWILAADGSKTTEVRSPGDGNATALAWAPDGTRSAIGTNTWIEFEIPGAPHELWVARADEASAERVVTADEILDIRGWSPDATWIAYQVGNDLDLVHADGSGQPVRVGRLVACDVTPWSADQRLFYVVSPNGPVPDSLADWQGIGSIMAFDPAGGPPILVIDDVDAYEQFDIG